MTNAQSRTGEVLRALLVAVMMMGGTYVLMVHPPAFIDPDVAKRILGIGFGIFLAVNSNSIPKKLTSLESIRCDPQKEQSLRRFTGWTMTLAGIAYALAWLVAPINYANWISSGLLLFALHAVMVRYLMGRRQA